MAQEIEIALPSLHKGQLEISKQAKRFNVLMCGRRFGKSYFGSEKAAEAAINGKRVGWFAPTYKILLAAFEDLAQILKPITKGKANKTDMRIQLITGGSIEFWSLQDKDAGRSRHYDLVVLDEGGLVRELVEIWNSAIRPTLTDRKGHAWILGTPKGQSGFFTMYSRGQSSDSTWKDWMSWQRGTIDNPYIDPAEIESARREMPLRIFNQEYLGIPDEAGGNPFGLQFIKQILLPNQFSTEYEYVGAGYPVAWGVDLAKSTDFTVLIGLDNRGHVCRFYRFQEAWVQTVAKIRAIIGWSPALVDATGVGDPVLEQLRLGGRHNFTGFMFSQPSKQQLMEGLALAIQHEKVKIPDGVIRAELDVFGFEYTRNGGVRYTAPAGFHDDCVYALGMAVRHAASPKSTMGVIEGIHIW